MFYNNPHASTVVELTAQSWLLTPTNYEMEKEEELKRMITGVQPYVTPAIWILTKERISPSLKELLCGKRPIERL
jgi:hypothetical protein